MGYPERQLERAQSIADLRLLARRRLPKAVFDFIDGGAADDRTLLATEDRGDVRPFGGLLDLRRQLLVGGHTAPSLWPDAGELPSPPSDQAGHLPYPGKHTYLMHRIG